MLELKEYERLEEIHDAEIRDGYYTWMPDYTELEAKAERLSSEGTAELAKIISDLVKYRNDRATTVINAAKLVRSIIKCKRELVEQNYLQLNIAICKWETAEDFSPALANRLDRRRQLQCGCSERPPH